MNSRRAETMWDPLALTYTMTGGAGDAAQTDRENRVAAALFEAKVTAEDLADARKFQQYQELLRKAGVPSQGLPFSSKGDIQQRLKYMQKQSQDKALANRAQFLADRVQEQQADGSESDEEGSEVGSLAELDEDQVEAAEGQARPPVARPGAEGVGGTQVNEQVDAEGNNSLVRGIGPIPTNSRPGGSMTQWGVQSYGVIPNPSVYAGPIRESAVMRHRADDAQYVRREFAPQDQFFSTPVVGPAPYLGGIYV